MKKLLLLCAVLSIAALCVACGGGGGSSSSSSSTDPARLIDTHWAVTKGTDHMDLYLKAGGVAQSSTSVNGVVNNGPYSGRWKFNDNDKTVGVAIDIGGGKHFILGAEVVGNTLDALGWFSDTDGGNQTAPAVYVFTKVGSGVPPDSTPTPAQKEAVDRSGNASREKREKDSAVMQARENARVSREAARSVALLNYAKKLLDRGESDKARERLREIVNEYPDSDSGREAKKLLEGMGK
jgi:hypothetical protein